MAEKNFIQSLIEFEKENIPPAIMEIIRRDFLNDPDFRPSRVAQASNAAKGLCLWIRALD